LPEVNLMERQLLYLLDWDTRVAEEDLFEHFEPFLAPIRTRLRLQQEQEMARERECSLQPSLAPSEASRGEPQNEHRRPRDRVASVFREESRSSPSPSSDRIRGPTLPHKRRQSPYRWNRSISPPSIMDLPALSRTESSAPGTSSRSSSIAPSSRSTPASISTCSSYVDEVVVIDCNASPTSSALAHSYVNVQAAHPKAQPQGMVAAPGELHQPSKKIKMVSTHGSGGGLISRFFGSATGSYAHRRTASRPVQA
jgi:hypothetical protein